MGCLSAAGKWVRGKGEIGESGCSFAAGESFFFLRTRENPQVNELGAVLVAQPQLSGWIVFEVELDPADAVVDPPPDPGGRHIVSV